MFDSITREVVEEIGVPAESLVSYSLLIRYQVVVPALLLRGYMCTST